MFFLVCSVRESKEGTEERFFLGEGKDRGSKGERKRDCLGLLSAESHLVSVVSLSSYFCSSN